MQQKILPLFLILSLTTFHCTNELPLSDLINNTITLKLLGTYESNDPYDFFTTIPKDDVITPTQIIGAVPTINDPTGQLDILNFANNQITGTSNPITLTSIQYYIDLAEVRIANGTGQGSQAISAYWQQFAIDRQLMCSTYTAADPSQTFHNCAASGGVDRLTQLFNGGFIYPAVDIASGFYNNLGIYFRRLVTSPGGQFNANGTAISSPTNQSILAAFDNESVYGTDAESYLQLQYGDDGTMPRLFPLQRFDLSITVQGDHEPYVLETRMFLKNLMMVHVRQASDANDPTDPTDTLSSAYVYVAPSDWNMNHAYQDLTYGTEQGGAVLMTARTYQPRFVGSIQMSTTVGGGCDYFAVVESGSTFPGTPVLTQLTQATAVLPLAATNGKNTTITNLPPGSYDVYRTCDITQCSNNSTLGTCDTTIGTVGTPSRDGYPETAVQCNVPGTPITVTSGTTTSGDATTCAASAACSSVTCP